MIGNNNFLFSALTLVIVLSAGAHAFAEETCKTSKQVKINGTTSGVAAATGVTVYHVDPQELSTKSILSNLLFLGQNERDPHTGLEEGPAHLLKLVGLRTTADERQSFAVDSSVRKLLVTLQATAPTEFQLFLPNGNLLRESDVGVERIQYSSGCMLKISNVQPGQWQFRARSTGDISLDVEGRTAIRFFDFRPVVWGGGPGHEDWFLTTEEPVTGSEITARATIYGDKVFPAVHEFQLRSFDGKLLQTIKPTEWHSTFLLQAVKIPKQALIYVIGEDKQGYRLERMQQAPIVGRQSMAEALQSRDASPLITATIENDIVRVLILLRAGANVNWRGKDGSTALMSAVEHGDSDNRIFKLLLSQGADVTAVTKYRGTALFKAAVAYNTEAVKELLARGADPNIRDGSGYTALEWAEKNDLRGILAVLRGATRQTSTHSNSALSLH